MEDYTIIYGGQPSRHELGTGFAVRNDLLGAVQDWEAVSPRLSRLRLTAKPLNITLINGHAPTEDAPAEAKDAFYEDMDAEVSKAPPQDMLFVMGDLNAKVGKTPKDICGNHSMHDDTELTDNGARAINLAEQRGLVFQSTRFQRSHQKTLTWRSADQVTVSQIDHIMTTRRHRNSVRRVTTAPEADCRSDHALVKAEVVVKLSTRFKRKPKEARAPMYNTISLKGGPNKEYEDLISALLLSMEEPEDLDGKWNRIHNAIHTAAAEALGTTKRGKRAGWLTEECDKASETRKRKWTTSQRQTQETETGAELSPALTAYKAAAREERRVFQRAKRAHLHDALDNMEACRAVGDMGSFYRKVREVKPYTGQRANVLRGKDKSLLTADDDILRRWQDHFQELFSAPEPTTPAQDDGEENTTEQDPPTLTEVKDAMAMLTRDSAPGPDNIPNILLRRRGDGLAVGLHSLFTKIWNEEAIPTAWNESIIVPLPKGGSPTDCNNYRGITLLNTAYKLFTITVKKRLDPYAEAALGDYQCGFRRGRSTMDQIFTLQQILEKRARKKLETHMVFIDFQKAYDSIHRPSLWNGMKGLGIPKKITALARACQENGVSRVRTAQGLSGEVLLTVGLKQGDILSPCLFNLALEYALRGMYEDLAAANGDIRLPAVLAFADDIALVCTTEAEAKEMARDLMERAAAFGLRVNAAKTKYMIGRKGEAAAPAPLHVGEVVFGAVNKFKYLGTTFSADCRFNEEAKARRTSGLKAYGALQNILRRNRATISTKMRTYTTIVRPAITYAMATWPMDYYAARSIAALENLIIRRMAGVKHHAGLNQYVLRGVEEARRITGFDKPILPLALKFTMRWAGHVARGSCSKGALAAFRAHLPGKNPVGGIYTPWRRKVDQTAQLITAGNWEEEALDRDTWRAICDAAELLPDPSIEWLRQRQRQRQRQRARARRRAQEQEEEGDADDPDPVSPRGT
ncbi:hypothetical protein ONE63_011462 [Megalurothrips usitatus]|uniref:Reverse transcriptase domain-containing protein n=1 Tax=Megalurothrips usitatus TaxID=439358 RepID=A0AAV7X2S1_9NEOP|nr:hypothetical protein ONE63_011462 [Megalurothrips usitatus]